MIRSWTKKMMDAAAGRQGHMNAACLSVCLCVCPGVKLFAERHLDMPDYGPTLAKNLKGAQIHLLRQQDLSKMGIEQFDHQKVIMHEIRLVVSGEHPAQQHPLGGGQVPYEHHHDDDQQEVWQEEDDEQPDAIEEG
mmetsp:Transcript_22555/g.64466  ORF Transcript_22555/g.64466 Transcript_22555/m.64466 type:complete len:136 (-) Transcript_22555:242-649(-)